ncbi:DnaA N-terminal domain-containing protein, partial [Ornithobacterium rhinotracheale]
MSVTAASVWSKCLEFIKDNINSSEYETWFKPIEAIKLDSESHVLTIQVPSAFYYEWIEE